jgi:hypothetical protein
MNSVGFGSVAFGSIFIVLGVGGGVQDVLWLEHVIEEIRTIQDPVSFVAEDAHAKYPQAIVRLQPAFLKRYKNGMYPCHSLDAYLKFQDVLKNIKIK